MLTLMFPINVVTKSSALVTMMMLKVISTHSVVLSIVPNVLDAKTNNRTYIVQTLTLILTFYHTVLASSVAENANIKSFTY